MAKKNRKLSQEKKLLGVGAALFVVTLVVVGSAFTFLINRVLPAIIPEDGVTEGETVHFNLEGFAELEL